MNFKYFIFIYLFITNKADKHKTKSVHLKEALFSFIVLKRPQREGEGLHTKIKTLHCIVTIVKSFPVQSPLFYFIAPLRPCPQHSRDQVLAQVQQQLYCFSFLLRHFFQHGGHTWRFLFYFTPACINNANIQRPESAFLQLSLA